MKFFLNKLSFHAQFTEAGSFEPALVQLLSCKTAIERSGGALVCDRGLPDSWVDFDMTFRQAVIQLHNRDRERSVLGWLSKNGPFFGDERAHSENCYLTLANSEEPITDTALGESAWLKYEGENSNAVSISPSNFTYTPIEIDYWDDTATQRIEVANYWLPQALTDILAGTRALESWEQMLNQARETFKFITISPYLEGLKGEPFELNLAEGVLRILKVINRYRELLAKAETKNEAVQFYQERFTAKSITDSSDSEKRDFKPAMTFKHPELKEDLFCPWHGKLGRRTFRIHFSDLQAPDTVYITYIGQKLTKK